VIASGDELEGELLMSRGPAGTRRVS
jgi:hypothetical protein